MTEWGLNLPRPLISLRVRAGFDLRKGIYQGWGKEEKATQELDYPPYTEAERWNLPTRKSTHSSGW